MAADRRCKRCQWARWSEIVLGDGHENSDALARVPALYCHVERPRIRVASDSFCPDFKSGEEPDTAAR